MKRSSSARLAGLVLAVALVASACSGGADDAAGKEGDPIPETTFETFDGEVVSLAAYSGRPLVVNFWASWCPSCVAEMSAAFLPAQVALGEEVAFLGINIQDERDKALELVLRPASCLILRRIQPGRSIRLWAVWACRLLFLCRLMGRSSMFTMVR